MQQFGPGFLATFLYYFASTAVLSTLVASKALGISTTTGLPQQVGMALGLFAGLLGGYFNRTISFDIPYKNRQATVKAVTTALESLGYQEVNEAEDVTTYQRSSMARFLSGKVYVQVDSDQSRLTIASRTIQIRSLRKKLS